jgi:undecaprenyl-diphosphatase
MDLVTQAAVLGALYGLAEFLPIASSWHLTLAPELLGWQDPFINSAGFDVMLHLGTLVALVVHFSRDLRRYAAAFVRSLVERRIGADTDRRLAWLLLVTIVPAGVFGALGEGSFDAFFRDHSAAFLVVLMLIGAGVLWLADAIGSQTSQLEGLRLRGALVIGAAQAFSFLPGVSRSGATVASGLFVGLTRLAAARFSFLMAVPVVAGAGLWKGREFVAGGLVAGSLAPLAVGFAAATLAALVSIGWMLAYMRRHSYRVFVLYRVAAAAVVIGWLLSR